MFACLYRCFTKSHLPFLIKVTSTFRDPNKFSFDSNVCPTCVGFYRKYATWQICGFPPFLKFSAQHLNFPAARYGEHSHLPISRRATFLTFLKLPPNRACLSNNSNPSFTQSCKVRSKLLDKQSFVLSEMPKSSGHLTEIRASAGIQCAEELSAK